MKKRTEIIIIANRKVEICLDAQKDLEWIVRTVE